MLGLKRLKSLFVSWLVVTTAKGVAGSISVNADVDVVSKSSTLDLSSSASDGGETNEEGNLALDSGVIERLIDWVRAKGGFVNSKLEVREVDPGRSQKLGIFATRDIESKDLLLSIPRDCVITGNKKKKQKWLCDTTKSLIRELKLGNNSYYAPYVDFLSVAMEIDDELPSQWTEHGMKLLLQVTGGSWDEDDQLVPPLGPVGWLDHEWRVLCKGRDDSLEQQAFLTVVHRESSDMLIPIFDIINHRNGHWLNTESNSFRKAKNIQLTASKHISAGSQIYISYNDCKDCGFDSKTYGTPEILRDHGFIEDMPQRWVFEQQGFAFMLDYQKKEKSGTADTASDHDNNALAVTWLSRSKSDNAIIEYLEEQIERLEGVEMNGFRVPQGEFDLIHRYHQAIFLAMDLALEDLQRNEKSCLAHGRQCTISNSRYDPLDSFSLEPYRTTCDITVTQDFEEYSDTEQIKSPYQVISFFEHPVTRDACFDLDDIYQICTSYRPHYHEMVVHYTARFLPDVKRVLWVGGGDSMLLHEILKYPSLEFVIGLELDQTVTRLSFKHFGTQPHWDNEKVQWWYGDAAKSLLMLPKKYFGSFDMVLVDLSETVMSARVTKGLDIMSALSLLLKPEGIFVKNEMYFEKLSPIFKHTIQAHIYDFPVIGSQALSLGSHTTNFVRGPITDHGVETMFSQLDDINRHLSVVRDYKMNPSARRRCQGEEDVDEETDQRASPGIAMILEAENTTIDLTQNIDVAIVQALQKEGLTSESTLTSETSQGSIMTFVLREGYVVARTWPEKKYCAYDIHLWSSFEKLEGTKLSLLAAVGSNSPSSFRIVAGGMFGVKTWKEDENSRGPVYTQNCSSALNETAHSAEIDGTIVAEVLETSLNALAPRDSVAVVVCGKVGSPCPSLDISKSSTIKEVVPLWSCSDVAGGIDYHPNRTSLMFSCEQSISSALEKSTQINGMVNIIVLDSSAEFAMAQIMHRLFKTNKNKNLFFTENLIVLAYVVEEVSWRRLFVQKFLEMLSKEPSFVSRVFYNNTRSYVEVDSYVHGNPHYVELLSNITEKVGSRTGLVGDVRMVRGGLFSYQYDFKPSQFFQPKDYDQRGPYEQWMSQHPTGHQTLFQMELADNLKNLSHRKVLEMVESALAEMKISTTPREFTNLGDGSLVVAMWPTGSVAALFNGRDHLDINLFTYEESVAFATLFSKKFTQRKDVSLKVVLRDEMPRGYGNVVNFWKELSPRKIPSWALHLDVA